MPHIVEPSALEVLLSKLGFAEDVNETIRAGNLEDLPPTPSVSTHGDSSGAGGSA